MGNVATGDEGLTVRAAHPGGSVVFASQHSQVGHNHLIVACQPGTTTVLPDARGFFVVALIGCVDDVALTSPCQVACRNVLATF